MISYIKPALILFTLMTLLTGVAYPLLVTGLAQLIFPQQANGSLMTDKHGNTLGSKLIGQAFQDPRYFWGRPSATAPYPNNAGASGGSNLGPTNPLLIETIKARIAALQDYELNNNKPVPIDLMTASGSGIDPHISPAAAEYQLNRVALIRQINPDKLKQLIQAHTEERQWGMLGEPRVNVLTLNLALDKLPSR